MSCQAHNAAAGSAFTIDDTSGGCTKSLRSLVCTRKTLTRKLIRATIFVADTFLLEAPQQSDNTLLTDHGLPY